MAIIRIPTDQADIAAALAAANPGDTIQFESGLSQTDFTVTVNNLTLDVAGGEDFAATLGAGVTQVTSTGAGSVEIIGNDGGNTITDNTTGSFFQEFTLGDGSDTLIAGRGPDVIRVGEGTKAIDLGAFADIGQVNADDGAINLVDTDFIVAETRGTSAISIVNFSLQEDQSSGEADDRLIFGGTTRADFAANAKFYVQQTTTGGSFPGALTSLGGYTDGTDWNLTIGFDYDGNGTDDAVFMLHDLFDADQQTQLKTLFTNTDFTPADIGNQVQIADADEAAFISGALNPLGNDNIGFALLVDPTRDALNDGQLDVATGLIAYQTITAALAAAGEGDVLVLAPGDHTFTSTVNSITVNVSNITFEPLGAGPDSLPAITLATGVQNFQSRLETGGLEITGSNTATEYATFETNDIVVGGAGADSFSSFGGADTFNGMANDDTAGYLLSAGGTLNFNGGEGGETQGDAVSVIDQTDIDRTIAISASAAGVSFEANGGGAAEVSASNIERLTASTGNGNDMFTLTGDFAAAGISQINIAIFNTPTTVLSSGGNNVFDASGVTSVTGFAFFAGAGNDTYVGSIGADLVFDTGGATNSFTGGGGDDSFFAFGGATTAHYALSSDNYVITSINFGTQFQVRALSGDEGTDTLQGVAQISFNGGAESGAITDFVSSPGWSFNRDSDEDLMFRFNTGPNEDNHFVLDTGDLGLFLGLSGFQVAGLGDFNGDGSGDYILQSTGGTAVSVLVSGSEGSFLVSDRLAKAIGDFDGDGDDDILMQFENGDKLIANAGAANTWLGLNDRSAMAVGDFDGDGDEDILFEFANGDKLITNVGNGNTWLGASDRTAKAVGDFDGDGDEDILFEFANGDKLIFNAGAGNTWLGFNDRSVVGVGDFDGDGDDDILFEFAGGNKLIHNVGTGNTWLGQNDRTAKAIGDFDGDGDDDIVMQFANGDKLIANVGTGNEWLGLNDRDVVGADLLGLGLGIDIA